MSKKRRNNKQSQKHEEIESAASEAAEDAVSAEMPNSSEAEGNAADASPKADQSAPENAAPDGAAPAASFGDAGTEYIEGFLREELGLDGDLTDDEFAMAALDFLGDGPVEGGTVYFDPNELSQLASQDAALDENGAAIDAFAQSVEELEEAIAAVSNPEFKDEGTVMMSLPDAIADDLLAQANAAMDHKASEAEAEAEAASDSAAVSEDAVVSEVDAAAEAVLEADVAAESVEDAAVEPAATEAPSTDEPVDALSAVAELEPAAEVIEPVENSAEEVTPVAEAEPAVEEAPALTSAEQAEMDEALAELLEIQAMLEDDAAEAEAVEAEEPVEAVAEAVAEIDEPVADVEAVEPVSDVADEAVAEEIVAPAAQADLSEDIAAIDEALASAESMVIDVDEPEPAAQMTDAELAAALVEEQPLRFDMDSIADALSAETAGQNDNGEQLLDALPDLAAFDDSNDYLDSIVAALDSEISEVNVGQATGVELQTGDMSDADIEQAIVFSIGESMYAIPIDNVLEIGEPLNATEVPFVPKWVRGVINLRGEIISLVDLRVYFDADPTTLRTADWMIVTQTSDASMLVGFVVDDVIGNRQFNRNEVAQLSSDVEDASIEFLQHIYRQEDGLVAVLDFDKLLRSSDMRQFEPV